MNDRPAVHAAQKHAHSLVVVLCAVFMTGLLIATAPNYGPFGDEFYYIECGKHLDLGYVDHPPLVAIVAFMVRLVFGESYLWLRMVTALAGGASVLLAAQIAKRLGGGNFARSLTALAMVSAPGIWAMFSFYSMNALDIVVIEVAILMVIAIAQGSVQKSWLAFGAVAGIGLQNKMTMLVFCCALLAGLAMTRHRTLLKTRWPYLAAILAGLLFLPNIIWQITHGWPTLEFVRVTQEYTIYPLSMIGFLEQIVLTLNPVTMPLWIGGLVFFLFVRDKKQYRILGVLATVFLAVYMIQRSKVYYVYPIMPLLFAGGAVAVERFSEKVKAVWLRASMAALIVISGIALLPFGAPVLPVDPFIVYSRTIGLMRNIRVQRGDRVDLPIHFALRFGWREMVEHVAGAYRTLSPEERGASIIITDNYSKAGAINYYRRDRGLPEAVSGHNNYRYWLPDSQDIKAAVAIGIEKDFLEQYFSDVTLFTVHRHPYAATWEVDQEIFVCRRPVASWQEVKPRLHWY